MARPEPPTIHYLLYLFLLWGVFRTVVLKLDEE